MAAHGTAYKRRQLAALLSGAPLATPLGCLAFSCNGRGTALYEEPSYDARAVASYVPVPVAGFLCNGEIGGWWVCGVVCRVVCVGLVLMVEVARLAG